MYYLNHHFSSKDDIINGVVSRFIIDTHAIDLISERTDLNGLAKIQELMYQAMFDLNIGASRQMSFSLLDNPKFFAQYILITNQQVAPYVESFLITGNQDGSVAVTQPQEMAELALLMLSTWFIQALYPKTAERFYEKLAAAKLVLERVGMDILNDDMLGRINTGIQKQLEELAKDE